MARTNRYPGNCNACSTRVPEGKGFIKREDKGWVTYCTSTQCLPADLRGEVEAASVRRMTADGRVLMPFDRAALPLLRSMPGAKFDRGADKCWRFSLDMRDRPRVLEIARRLELDIDPELLDIVLNPLAAAAKARAAVTGREFQVEGITWLADRKRAILADDMGLGKTVQALMAADPEKGVLVVSPQAVKFNWTEEAEKWRPDYTCEVLKGRKSFRWPKPGELLAINPDILPPMFSPKKWVLNPYYDGSDSYRTPKRCKKCYGQGCKDCHETGYDKKNLIRIADLSDEDKAAAANVVIIADEAHLYKNPKTSRSKKMHEMVRVVAQAWALTGTPLLSRPMDLWGLLQTFHLAWEVFGSWKTFTRCFNAVREPVYRGGPMVWKWGNAEPEVAERLRRVMLRRLKKDVLKDLPGKTYRHLLIRDLGKGLDGELNETADILAATDMWDEDGEEGLPDFYTMSAVRAKLATAMIPAMLEVVESFEDAEEPLVVASAHREPILALGEREGWAIITGDTSAEDRQEIKNAFQRGDLKGVGLTIKAGGVGITLTRASNMLYVDYDWTPALNVQMEDRICRIGQTAAGVMYHVLVYDHPLIRRVYAILEHKMKLFRDAIDSEAEYSAQENALPTLTEESDEDYAARIAKRDRKLQAAREKVEKEEQERKLRVARERVPGWRQRMTERATRPEMPLTYERIATIKSAMRDMLASCDGARTRDGVGFNKPDATMSRWLVALGLDDEDTLRTAERMLTRYYRQLHGSYPTLFENR